MGLHTLAAIQFSQPGLVSGDPLRAHASFQNKQATIRVFRTFPIVYRTDVLPRVPFGGTGQ